MDEESCSPRSDDLGGDVTVNSWDEKHQLHPLLNPLIVGHMFSLASFDIDVWKNCRLVCKTWFEESLPRWRSTAVLTVIRDKYPDFYGKGYNGKGIAVPEFQKRVMIDPQDDMLQLKGRPYLKYRVKG